MAAKVPTNYPIQNRWLKPVTVALLAALVLAVAVLASTPPTSRDALIHHLAVPKLYLEQGGMVEIPSLPFSYYPSNLGLLYWASLALGSDIAAKYIHFTFALLTAGIVFAYLRNRAGTFYGLLGALILLSTPVVIRLSTMVYVDLGLLFFSSASLLALFQWRRSRYKVKWLLMAAVACGLALGTKYNALISLLLLAFMTGILYVRDPEHRRKRIVGSLAFMSLFCGVTLLVFSPWMIRNYRWTGNPVYPLYQKFFSTQTPSRAASESLSFGPLAFRALVYGERDWQIALLPFRIFFQGKDDDPRYFDARLNPMLLLLLPFAFLKPRSASDPWKLEKWMMLGFAGLFILMAMCTQSVRIRYFLPALTPLALLTVFGVQSLADRFSRRDARLVLGVSVGFFLTLNLYYLMDLYQRVEPLRYLSGALSRSEYLNAKLPTYAPLEFINRHLPDNASVFFILVGNQGYYCDRAYGYDHPPSGATLHNVLKLASSPRDVNDLFKQKGYSHILVSEPRLMRWADTNFTEAEKQLMFGFFREAAHRIYFKNGFGIYELT
ncbi:MAG: phospholipid carrier-dependent glycosyltransferase [Deltaproteobacteria bacterium]|nr:phospholipid carrier-dependent glycosyltransferase [Deltaproteobacteria bacterium]